MPTTDDFRAWRRRTGPLHPTPATSLAFQAKLGAFVGSLRGWSDDELRELTVPSLVLVGDKDFVRSNTPPTCKRCYPRPASRSCPAQPTSACSTKPTSSCRSFTASSATETSANPEALRALAPCHMRDLYAAMRP